MRAPSSPAVRWAALVVAAFAGFLGFDQVVGDSDAWGSVVLGLAAAALVAASVYTLALEACRGSNDEKPSGPEPS